MKEIIFKYLNKNYRFTYSTYNSYFVKDRVNDEEVRLSEVMQSLMTIFAIEEADMIHIFDEWADQQSTMLNNRKVEMQEKLYSVGLSIELTPVQMNKLLEDGEPFSAINRILL